MNDHIIFELSKRYPQLLLPLSRDTKDSEEYKAAVMRGEPLHRAPDFSFSPDDYLQVISTPAGDAEVLFLSNRSDYVHCVQALAYRCEPRDVPASIGANTVSGLINWEKIRKHRSAYLLSGGSDWPTEFRRFTQTKENYRDSLIILSSGEYSFVPAELTDFLPGQWKEISITIRKYHELTHFVCRKLFPDRIDAVKDEVIADLIGLIAATGEYDTRLARLFLGIEGDSYRWGSRLENYTSAEKLPTEVLRANQLINEMAPKVTHIKSDDIFKVLLLLMSQGGGRDER